MRREDRDELLRGFLAINAMLREEAKALRRAINTRREESKHNPNWRLQPRAPKGVTDGGQWVGGRLKQSQQAVPETTSQTPSADERFRIQSFELRTNANDNRGLVRIPLSASPLAALTLPLPLYGDTPRPKIEARQITEDLLLVTVEVGNQRLARFQRIVRPERRVPLHIFGIDIGLQTTEPAQLEILDVEVSMEGDDVVFQATSLALAYGREVPGIPIAGGPDADERPQIPGIVTRTWEEADMVLAMRLLGRPAQEIETALDAVRRNHAAFRTHAGIAFWSSELPRIRGTWLDRDTTQTTIPAEVAERLRGKVFRSSDEGGFLARCGSKHLRARV